MRRSLSLALLDVPVPIDPDRCVAATPDGVPVTIRLAGIGKVRSQTSLTSLLKPKLHRGDGAAIQNRFLQLLMDVSFDLDCAMQRPPSVILLWQISPAAAPRVLASGYASADGEKCGRTLIIASAYPEACGVSLIFWRRRTSNPTGMGLGLAMGRAFRTTG